MPLTINNTQVRTPTELKVATFRISRAERLASGLMSMEIVAVKRRLDLNYSFILETDIKLIMDLLESKVYHTVVYPDSQKGESHTITVYLGDIGQNAGQRIANTRYWRDVSIALIER